MNKLLITTITVGAMFTLASAEELRPTKMVRAMPIRASSTETQGRPEVMPRLEAPKTGDSVIDNQISNLVKEREAKIKAIHEEYKTKIDALIGNKKVEGRGMMGTSSRPMEDRWNNGSGTRPMMNGDYRNASGTPGMMKRGGEGNKPAPRPMGVIENFFRSFFGGDASKAEAESQDNY